jgi:hypothetical protein
MVGKRRIKRGGNRFVTQKYHDGHDTSADDGGHMYHVGYRFHQTTLVEVSTRRILGSTLASLRSLQTHSTSE